MGIHQAFMNQFEEILDGVDASSSILKWKSPKCIRQIFICQLLLKNADISNPVCVYMCSFLMSGSIDRWVSVVHFLYQNDGHLRYNKNGHVNINLKILCRFNTA